jgi:hypothetical protein
MASSKTPQFTDFTIDILGRDMRNGLDEALHSIDKNAQRPDGSPQTDARPFNAIIIGGGGLVEFLPSIYCMPTRPIAIASWYWKPGVMHYRSIFRTCR